MSEIERLTQENEALRAALSEKVIDSTKLRAFLPADGGFTIGLEGGPCALLADAFGEQLYTSDVINYLQLTFTSSTYPDLGQIVVTLQRCKGKTPHELRMDAEQERDQLKAENAELVNLMRRVVAEHPRRNHKNDGNGPGHGHRVPGVWDEDNGELAGKPCAWCSIWNAAKGIVERHEQAMTKEQP